MTAGRVTAQEKGAVMAEILHDHINSEGERIAIMRVTEGDFVGRNLLVIYDDWPSQSKAPMLLDDGTVDWLKKALDDA